MTVVHIHAGQACLGDNGPSGVAATCTATYDGNLAATEHAVTYSSTIEIDIGIVHTAYIIVTATIYTAAVYQTLVA